MLAIDTNVLVRLIARDDINQAERVRALFEHEIIFIASTVLLESDWVLRRGLGLTRKESLQALSGVVRLQNVELEDVTVVHKALDWAASGMDFADALHLAKAQNCQAFVSFDKRMRKTAEALSLPVREP